MDSVLAPATGSVRASVRCQADLSQQQCEDCESADESGPNAFHSQETQT